MRESIPAHSLHTCDIPHSHVFLTRSFEILIRKILLVFFHSLFGDMSVDKQSLLCNHIHGHYCDSFTSGISVEKSSVEFEFLQVVLFSVFSGMIAVAAEVNQPFLHLCTPNNLLYMSHILK